MWDLINTDTYLAILEIQNEESGLNLMYELSLLLLDDVDENNFIEKYKSELDYLNSSIVNKPYNGDYSIYPLGHLSLGEWIDLDSYLGKRDYIKALAILFRASRLNEWGHTEYEPYNYNLEDRENYIRNIPVTQISGILEEVIQYRSNILTTYKDILSISRPEEEEDLSYLSSTEIIEIQSEIEKQKLKEEYSWFNFLDVVSNSNWSYIKDILNLKHLVVFNMLRTKKIFKT